MISQTFSVALALAFLALTLAQPVKSQNTSPAARRDRQKQVGGTHPSPALPEIDWTLVAITSSVFALLFLFGRKERGPRTDDAHGSAAYARPRELRELVVPMHLPVAQGALTLGYLDARRRIDLPRQLTVRHVLLLGPTGSRKTRGTYLPNVAWHRGGSQVVYDMKGELFDLCGGVNPGRRALRYAPLDPDRSEPFNWIPLCRDNPRLADDLARAVIVSGGRVSPETEFWVNGQIAILAALFCEAAYSDEPTPATVQRWLVEAPDGRTLIRTLALSRHSCTRELIAAAQKGSDRVTGEMLLTLLARTRWMADPCVKRFTSSTHEPPDFASLRRVETALFWVVGESDVNYLKPLTALFFTLLLRQVTQGSGTLPLTCLFDEFGNLGIIPGFATLISTVRSKDVSFVLGLQSLAQLEAYGADDARTILQNCATKLVLGGCGERDCETISRSVSDETRSVEVRSRSAKAGSGESVTVTPRQFARRLITPGEVREISDDEQLVLIANRRPFKTKRYFYQGAPRPAATRPLPQAREGAPFISGTDGRDKKKGKGAPPQQTLAKSAMVPAVSPETSVSAPRAHEPVLTKAVEPHLVTKSPLPATVREFATVQEKILHYVALAGYLSARQIRSLVYEHVAESGRAAVASRDLRQLLDTKRVKSQPFGKSKVYFSGRSCNPTVHNLAIRDILVSIIKSNVKMVHTDFFPSLDGLNPDLETHFLAQDGTKIRCYWEYDSGSEGISELVSKAKRYRPYSGNYHVTFIFSSQERLIKAAKTIREEFIRFAVIGDVQNLNEPVFWCAGAQAGETFFPS